MKESAFWQQVKAGLEKAAPGIDLARIENAAGSGISDVNACFRGVEVWLELKIMRSGKLNFEPSQKAWIMRRRMAGGRVYCIARHDEFVELYSGTVCRHGETPGTPLVTLFKPFNWAIITDFIFEKRS